MSKELFVTDLFLPAQAAAETEATITKWFIEENKEFRKGQELAEVESAKSTFTFEAPCNGYVLKLFASEGKSIAFDAPVMQVKTDDESVRRIMPGLSDEPVKKMDIAPVEKPVKSLTSSIRPISILGIGTYLPERRVCNSDLLTEHPDITEEYIFGVTGIRERRWARQDEKPSDMAYVASMRAIENSGLTPSDIDAIVVSTTTPDVVMPSTACILQDRLGIRGVPAFDLNAACSGWLYSISVAKGLILSGLAQNVLVCASEMQSRVLDKKDRNTYFLFGDGAGATVISGSIERHIIKQEILIADPQGLSFARREFPGYEVPQNSSSADPWIRLDGKALFRFATESFSSLIRELVIKSEWTPEQVRWVVPHQANSRILKAAATKSGISFDRFYMNIDRVGNSSSASIPIALSEIEKGLQTGDRLVFCTVGAGITAAAISIEW